METVTGYVTGINGNLANVSFNGSVHKNEVGYILVDGKRLKGEVSVLTTVSPACRSTRCPTVSRLEIR